MQIGIENYYQIYNKQNKIFDLNAYPIGENLGYPFVLLKQKLKEMNFNIDTLDIHPIEQHQKVIFLDFPSKSKYFDKLRTIKSIELYLIIFESEVIYPDNWLAENHKYFKKIFTWNDNWVDNKKYIKFFWPNKIPEKVEFDLTKKSKLCTMIAGHKSKSHPLELYSEREKAIRWFEQNHPEDFDLYGIGWYKYRFMPLSKLFKINYPSYKGQVKSKIEILQKYKFAICYENAKDIPGYITEKIFDCFFAGCVPIYLGAPNVTDYIPKNTFIDKRIFVSYDALYKYLTNMSDEEYVGYLDAIKNYILGSQIYPFSAEFFVEKIITEIIGEDKTVCKEIHHPVLLTIGIPTYNGAKYLNETINSILAQLPSINSDELEILISDNASTDETSKIIYEYIEKYPQLISYYKNDENIGFDKNLDLIFVKAKGKYVWLLGNSEKLKSGILFELLNKLKKDSYDNVLLNFEIYSEKTSKIEVTNNFNIDQEKVFYSKDDFFINTLYGITCMSANIILKKSWNSVYINDVASWRHVEKIINILASGDYKKSLYFDKICFTLNREIDGWWTKEGNLLINTIKLQEIIKTMKYKKYSRKTINSLFNHSYNSLPRIIIQSKLNNLKLNFSIIVRSIKIYYRKLSFWVICLPMLLIPNIVFKWAKNSYRFIHRLIKRDV